MILEEVKRTGEQRERRPETSECDWAMACLCRSKESLTAQLSATRVGEAAAGEAAAGEAAAGEAAAGEAVAGEAAKSTQTQRTNMCELTPLHSNRKGGKSREEYFE